MKKIYLTENKLNVLLEYAGFVDGFQTLIEHIYEKSEEFIVKSIKSIVKNRLGKTKEEIFNVYEMDDNVSLDKPIKDWIIPQHHLKMVKVNNLKQITIMYMIDDDIDGGFEKESLSYDNKSNMFNNITIVINAKKLFLNGVKYKVTLQHELTHAFELMQRYLKNGEEHTKMNFSNKYYKPSVTKTVEAISYYFSKLEMNAVISETYYLLTQSNAVDEQQCWDIINDEKSFANLFMHNLNMIKSSLENSINCTYTVMEFLHMNPEYIDMFPNPRNNNVKSYQKRLIRTAEFKINYLKKKLNKVVKTYLKRKSGVR